MRLFGGWCTCIGLVNGSKLYIEGWKTALQAGIDCPFIKNKNSVKILEQNYLDRISLKIEADKDLEEEINSINGIIVVKLWLFKFLNTNDIYIYLWYNEANYL